MTHKIDISDFPLFCDVVKSLGKMSDGIKFTVSDCGMTVYAKNDYSKCEMTSNCITSHGEVSFSIGDIGTLTRVMSTLRDLYGDDSGKISMEFDSPFLRFSSGKFKTKLATIDEDAIRNYIGTKVHTDLTPLAEFTTSSQMIKGINAHSFVFSDSGSARIYLTVEPDMQNNTVFATIGKEDEDLSNSATIELGLLTYGSFSEKDSSGMESQRKIILDFNRLNILNMVQSDEIKVMVAKERPVLSANIRKTGNNGTFFNLNIYSFLMVR